MKYGIIVLLGFVLAAVALYGCSSGPAKPGNNVSGTASGGTKRATSSTKDRAEVDPEEEPKAQVIYVRQRCIVVETENHVLVFDPVEFKTRRQKTFINGFVDIDQYRGSNVTVFITSAASDRFSPEIMAWRKRAKKVKFVIGPGVAERDARFKGKGIYKAMPGKKLSFRGIKVDVVPVSRVGRQEPRVKSRMPRDSVAFLVSVDRLKIYYSGEYGGLSKAAASAIPGDGEINIACHAFNSRKGQAGRKGLVEFAKKFSPRMLVPVVPGGNTWVISRLAVEVSEATLGVHVWNYRKMGESFKYPDSLPSNRPSKKK
ncbi:MAG: MBL fold metallo-hydrolase [Planctomycetota bacterium]|nr:MAG: MBL fold metallo-hydrolase [Planctomycetota bacterium]